MTKILLLGLIPVLIGSCARLDPGMRQVNADDIASSHHFQAHSWRVGRFDIQGYQRIGPGTGDIVVYIEGDGLAYRRRNRVSADPTPLDAYTLHLAVQDTSRNVVYLARPCQFLSQDQLAECPQRFWTSHRYSEEVVSAYMNLLDQLSTASQNTRFRLIGYSGGGVIAVLLAARRNDIDAVMTVAANLDLTAWVEHHKLSPLAGSINPADYPESLTPVPQWHLAGAKDEIVPAEILQSYLDGRGDERLQQFRVVEGFEHDCCWRETWPEWLAWFYK